MAAAKKKKVLTYNGKPIMRCGNRIYYGNLADKLILVLDILESKKVNDLEVSQKILVQVMDNTGELGKGQIFRKATRDNLYKALDIGEWWLKDALKQFA
ncbi:MAG: hypothetical protein J1G06_08455 [Oscillospiraceae bacterium]|nr:hypothetical protein [Oscillospiraceae bacterium]